MRGRFPPEGRHAVTIHLIRPAPQVVLLELAHPPANALGAAMRQQLNACLEAIEDDTEIRAVVLTGRGRIFCGGDDLREMAGRGDGGLDAIHAFNAMVDRLEALRVPVIAAINGGALGGGLELALACDIRLAAEDASFTASGVNVGLMASVRRLPRLIGVGPAKAMLLTGAPIDAATALTRGLVTGVFPADRLLAEALALADRIASRAPLSVEAAKRMAGRALDLEPDQAAAVIGGELAALAASADHREAVASFLEKRPAVFRRA